MRFTLRQLEVFLAVARASNMTRAAAQLNMSQSAASSALKDLETQFDLLLFDRIGKRLHLNEQGRQLRPRAESLMAMAEEIEQDLLQSTSSSQLNIGATLSIGNSMAVQMVADYLEQHPGASINLDIENTEHIAEKVLNYELDMGMVEGEFQHPQLRVKAWRDDEMSVFCSPQHPLAKVPALDDDDLLRADWILREPGSGTRQSFDRVMHGLLPELRVKLELQQNEAIKRAVQEALGIGCLSLMILEEDFQRGDLVRLATPTRDLHRKLYLILHRQKHLGAGIKAWLELCERWTGRA